MTRSNLAGRLFAVASLAAGLAPAALPAQAVIKGQVRAAQTQVPLSHAEVLIENLGLRATTGDSGQFRLSGIPLGRHEFRVRRIGFVSAVAPLRVEAVDSLILELSLEAWVPELETLFATAPLRRSARMEEFEGRRRSGLGRYLTPDQLRDNEHRSLADLMRELGIEVSLSFGNQAFAVGIGSPTLLSASTRCVMGVWLDGIDLPGLGDDLNQYPVSMLGAVEVYRRPVEAPIQFTPTGALCGVILLWSRER
ncbi:MAG: carboxypeptidase-like regulatory domain-containing protein [Gemmatimonadales bacterium]|nr:carboxypeptidase-like regulatory domain-containing protein [Gemmatimonadales bacterium]